MATFRDLKAFVERDGWTDEPTLTRGRARTGHHWRYRKALPDGTVLRTKVSHDVRAEIGTDLFKHILRDQLRVSEDPFWDVVRGRATDPAAPPAREAPRVPGWLVQRLLLTVGLSEEEVRAMTPEQARAAWEAYQAKRR